MTKITNMTTCIGCIKKIKGILNKNANNKNIIDQELVELHKFTLEINRINFSLIKTASIRIAIEILSKIYGFININEEESINSMIDVIDKDDNRRTFEALNKQLSKTRFKKIIPNKLTQDEEKILNIFIKYKNRFKNKYNLIVDYSLLSGIIHGRFSSEVVGFDGPVNNSV